MLESVSIMEAVGSSAFPVLAAASAFSSVFNLEGISSIHFATFLWLLFLLASLSLTASSSSAFVSSVLPVDSSDRVCSNLVAS